MAFVSDDGQPIKSHHANEDGLSSGFEIISLKGAVQPAPVQHLRSFEHERYSMIFRRLVFTVVLGVSDIALAQVVCLQDVGKASQSNIHFEQAAEDGIALGE